MEYFGYPLFFVVVLSFIANFLACRSLTNDLIKSKKLERDSEEFNRVLVLWFFPLVGYLGLLIHVNTLRMKELLVKTYKWFLLK